MENSFMQQFGKYIIWLGFLLLALGLIFYFFGNKLSWLGKLPGDFQFKAGNWRIYIPLTTIIIITLLLNLILWFIRKL